jgi:hypothetical protein
MGFTDRLGGLARDWARARATELLTTDRSTREDASLRADQLERDARVALGDQAVRTALPGLADATDRQEERRRIAEAEQVAAEQSEVGALPRALVDLRLRGAVHGDAAAELPLHWDEADGELLLEVLPLAGARPRVGDHALDRLACVVPDFHGDGTYDLVALYAARSAAGTEDVLDWGVELDDGGEASLWCDLGAGPAVVTVTDGGRRVGLRLTLAGAAGRATVTAEITRTVLAAPL